MQNAAHTPLQGLVDHLVLLHPGLAREFLADDVGGVVVPVAGEVLDGDLRVGKARLDQPLDLFGIHGHRAHLQTQGTVRAYDRPPAPGNTTDHAEGATRQG